MASLLWMLTGSQLQREMGCCLILRGGQPLKFGSAMFPTSNSTPLTCMPQPISNASRREDIANTSNCRPLPRVQDASRPVSALCAFSESGIFPQLDFQTFQTLAEHAAAPMSPRAHPSSPGEMFIDQMVMLQTQEAAQQRLTCHDVDVREGRASAACPFCVVAGPYPRTQTLSLPV